MTSEAFCDNAVVLVAADSPGWDALQAAIETLESFGVGWRRGAADVEPAGLIAEETAAVIVASPDHVLPARWSGRTGLPTVRVPAGGGGIAGLDLLRAGEGGPLPAGSIGETFATMAIGAAGAKNAALFIVAALATVNPALREKLAEFRRQQTGAALAEPSPRLAD